MSDTTTSNTLQRLFAKEHERQKARRAAWKALSARRRMSVYALYVATVVAAVAGYFAGVMHTTAIIMLFALGLLEPWLRHQPVKLRHLSHGTLFILFAIAFGVFSNALSNTMVDDSGRFALDSVTNNTASFREEGDNLLAIVRAGGMNVHTTNHDEDSYNPLYGLRNDAPAQALARFGQNLELFGPNSYAEGLEGTSLIDIATATTTVMLIPNDLNAYFAPRVLALEEAAQAQYGVSYDRLMEDKNHDAIKTLNAQMPLQSFAITCIYNAQGTPIVVGSTPRGLPFNLINAPIGEPYVQACREARRP